jgi:hypothetical protein
MLKIAKNTPLFLAILPLEKPLRMAYNRNNKGSGNPMNRRKEDRKCTS